MLEVRRGPYAHRMRTDADQTAGRLSRAGLAWRAAVTVGVLAALVWGSGWGKDDAFPAGPMVQYAFYVNPNGTISSNYIEADTTAGTRIKVRLSSEGVGIPRGEIEASSAGSSLIRPCCRRPLKRSSAAIQASRSSSRSI